MAIRRRRFVQSLLLAPAAPAALLAQQPAAAPPAAEKPAPQQLQPNTPARQIPRQPQNVPHLQVVSADLTAQPTTRYFTAVQFSTLQKLGSVLVPAIKGHPSALEAQAPEFLDFLLSVSPAPRQQLYRSGLDTLEHDAKKQFHQSFAELDESQADSLLRPLLVVRPWPEDLPADPLKNFIAQVHQDLRTATANSREAAASAASSGRRFTRGFGTSGFYWSPIDPIIES
jgi:hypothetical protein